MEWTFIYLMVVLKIPIVALFTIVWWAVHNTDETAAETRDEEGGSKTPPHPREPRPTRRRPRGPHGEPQLPAPPRTRTTVARARETT